MYFQIKIILKYNFYHNFKNYFHLQSRRSSASEQFQWLNYFLL
jgi:hypothetical protein